jgi:hypothetical protein
MTVVVPVTSLCPCSKKISRYGAHNQRSHITIATTVIGDVAPEELIRIAEDAASCELWGLLKRPDEQYVTERAYDNPKFVEDLVRDVAYRLIDDARLSAFTVEAENFESIHNHSAYALGDSRDLRRRAVPGASQACEITCRRLNDETRPTGDSRAMHAATPSGGSAHDWHSACSTGSDAATRRNS